MQPPSTMEKQGSITASTQGNDLGDSFQTKVNDQMKVMAAVKARLAEEEDEIDCQRRAVELDIHTRYATGRNLTSTHFMPQVGTWYSHTSCYR